MENSTLGKIVAIMTIIGTIYTIMQYHKPETEIIKPQLINKPIESTDKGIISSTQVHSPNPTEIKRETTNDNKISFDISDFINIPETKYDLAICFVDETNNFRSEFTYSVGKIYKSNGKKVILNLFNNKFLKTESFSNFYMGDNTLIKKLGLANYVDKIILGKLTFETHNGKLVNGTIICNVNLEVNILSAQSGTLLNSFSINNVSANDVTESAAKSAAVKKLIDIYSNQHLNL